MLIVPLIAFSAETFLHDKTAQFQETGISLLTTTIPILGYAVSFFAFLFIVKYLARTTNVVSDAT